MLRSLKALQGGVDLVQVPVAAPLDSDLRTKVRDYWLLLSV